VTFSQIHIPTDVCSVISWTNTPVDLKYKVTESAHKLYWNNEIANYNNLKNMYFQ